MNTRNSLKKNKPKVSPPIENNPPNKVAKNATIIPNTAPARPIITTNKPAAIPMTAAPKGIIIRRMNGARIINPIAFI